MARTLPEGQKMWIAMPGQYSQVTIVERGTGGHVFKGEKPEKPYIVEDQDQDRFIIGLADLYDSPREAAIEAARLAGEHGALESNPEDENENPDGDTEEDDGDE